MASNGATPLAAPFSDCNTKSGAVALFPNATFPLTVKLFVVVLVVTILSLSTCQETVIPLPAFIAQVVLRVQSISTLQSVSTSLR